MDVLLRPFTAADVPLLQQWCEQITAGQYMSRFFPNAYTIGENPNSPLYVWYVIRAGDEDVGTIWLEKEDEQDSTAVLGILLGRIDRIRGGPFPAACCAALM
ncbi:MAG: GNAT family N-acetyltransferase [Anaerolineales bacterium]|nr:GNAT family N-acetyltransferase [Anaerolineales bacterium]